MLRQLVEDAGLSWFVVVSTVLLVTAWMVILLSTWRTRKESHEWMAGLPMDDDDGQVERFEL